MAENFKFKTETKRLLDMMINSIYTHKEIFLRELISNASDAIDKRHFISLTNQNVKPHDYEILVEASKKDRTITITDNGIGMTEEEIQNNLGTIAKSGSKEFLEKIENEKNKDDVDIIGQFGVGFYSAFMIMLRYTLSQPYQIKDIYLNLKDLNHIQLKNLITKRMVLRLYFIYVKIQKRKITMNILMNIVLRI
mgnify:CR=1 FL=1